MGHIICPARDFLLLAVVIFLHLSFLSISLFSPINIHRLANSLFSPHLLKDLNKKKTVYSLRIRYYPSFLYASCDIISILKLYQIFCAHLWLIKFAFGHVSVIKDIWFMRNVLIIPILKNKNLCFCRKTRNTYISI